MKRALILMPRKVELHILPRSKRGDFRQGRLRSEGAFQAEIAAALPRLYPIGRIGRVEDLGRMAAHLASDESSWTTGSVVSVDGGLAIT